MSSLSNQQKQLLFDYCIGLASDREAAEAEQLIFSNAEAAELHSKFKSILAPLDSLEAEPCPDDLAEGTILRLNNLARASQFRLQQLLAAEQTRPVTTTVGFWRNWGEVVAVAAVIVLIAGVLFPSLNFFRQQSWKHRCQMQLLRVGQGIGHYSSEHDGRLPAVATAAGAPWWKVGEKGKENHSNTRHIWLLVKGNYVDPADFVCPGQCQGVAIQFDPSEAKKYNDFPDRKYITYSFRIWCTEPPKGYTPGRKVLLADLNPLFETLPQSYSTPLRLRISKDLLTLNSPNHNRRGQNVLFSDGSTEFVKTRYTGITQDDIFTLQEMSPGCEVKGCEVPSCETDTLVAP